jgi:hypothetical protein
VAIEFAIVSMALILFSFGTIELGRALEVRHKLSFVADRASREVLTDSDISSEDLEDDIREWFDAPEAELLQVEIGTESVDGISFRTVAISYPFVLLIPQLTSNPLTLRVEQRVPIT